MAERKILIDTAPELKADIVKGNTSSKETLFYLKQAN